MSHDVVADGLNQIKNASKARRESVKIDRISNLLIEVLKIMKQKGAIQKYKIDSKGKSVEVTLKSLSECKAIKPRFNVNKYSVEKYRRRYLPARNIGTMIISTNQGLIDHEQAIDKEIGGSLIAYFY